MAYLPDDHLFWDFWFAPQEAGGPLHMFYLRVPVTIGDPEDRHWQAEVGHATSDDLVNWRDQGVALTPSDSPAWDDKAIWTGSIMRHGDTWYWFYTALTHADTAQRIGLLTSTDLNNWKRHPDNPLLEADGRWYETLETSPDGHVAFRDPWVTTDGEGWLMYITARTNHGAEDGRGVIALARSSDLIHWTLGPPITTPGDFAELEVPQYLELGDRRYLLFCTGKPSCERLETPGALHWIGTHYLTAEAATGPWHLAPDPPMAADTDASWYAGRAVKFNGDWYFLAWRRQRDGVFAGGLSNPARLNVTLDGRLHVNMNELDE